MSMISEEQKKVKFRPKPGKGWKSEDSVNEPDSEKVLAQDEDDILATVLEENTALHVKNAKLMKRLSDHGRKFRESKSQFQECEEEIRQLKQAEKVQPTSVRRQVASMKSDGDHTIHRRDDYQHSSKQKDELENEISRLSKENRRLQQSLDCLMHRDSTEMKELRIQAKHFEIEYLTEKEDNENLRSEVQRLRHQVDSLLSANAGATPESADQCNSDLQTLIKQLNEDVAKLREHSKSQSRQIMRLRQQTEVTTYMEEQLHSMEILLREAENEKDLLQSKLVPFLAQDDGSAKVNQITARSKQQEVRKATNKNEQEEPLASNVEAVKKDDSACGVTIESPTIESDQDLWRQLQSLNREKQELQYQLEALQLQVQTYRSDFEEERRDRENAHNKMADMTMKLAQLEGHGRAGYQAIKGELGSTYQELQSTKRELQRHKEILADFEIIYQKRTQDATMDIVHLNEQVAAAEREQQAKASQVKQYAKENNRLKQEIEQFKLLQVPLVVSAESSQKVNGRSHRPSDKPQPLRISSQSPPPKTRERSRSISPVAVVRPTCMSQSPRLRSPHEQSAHIEPVMGPIRHRCTSTPTAIASPQFSPPQSHGHTSNSQQEGINFTESVKIREENHRAPDNPQTVKHKSQVEQDPRHDEVEQLEPLRRSPMAGDTQPFIPIFPSVERHSERHMMAGATQQFTSIASLTRESNEDTRKVLCRTPGCSFHRRANLNGLCTECWIKSYGNSDLLLSRVTV